MPYRTLRLLLIILGLFIQTSFIAVASGFTVVIDPGHGGKDSGTLGSSCKEKDIVLNIGLKLGKLIASKQPDVKIIFTRSTDEFIELNQRAIIANKAKANLFISLHADHADSPNPHGPSTFTLGQNRTAENMAIAKRENSVILLEDDYKQRYEGFDPTSPESYIMFEFMQDNYMNQSIQFASTIQNKFVANGRYDRGVRQDVFLVLRCTSMPSVLVETGFLSNPTEEAYLKSEEGQEQTALCIYKGFADFRTDYERKSTNSSSLKKPVVEDVPDTLPVTQNRISDTTTKTTASISFTSKVSDQNDIVYKVQILTSEVKLSERSTKLKGQQADYYVEKKLYKYTVGSFNTFEEANTKRKELSNRFPDAFVAAFQNGHRVAIK
ncbi:MAG TPA: N-acetylmuramoyl-L-alanine amidase [Bacteroidales bacterium]|nr:N-acetylmuramoyl-L-alanine amidase [Bacteroidales bacterium]